MGSWQLDEDSFYECCQILLQQSEQLRDGWSWEQVQGTREGFLRKTALCSVVIDSKQNQKEHEVDLSGAVEEQISGTALEDPEHTDGEFDCQEDAEVLINPAVTEGSSRVFQFEYHVLYSCSYRTPVLYFRAFTLEGKSLSLEEVWSCTRPRLRLQSQDVLLNTVTQQEHPLLGQAFFMLHPCKTEDFMKPVLEAAQESNRSVNYVLTWLSVVAPLVGLDVPLEYSLQPGPVSEPD